MNLFCKLSEEGAPILERLFAVANDIDIYCELLETEVQIGVPMYSPLRLDDHDPSFSLFIPTRVKNTREEEVWWRDFKGDSGDVFKFVKLYAKLHYDEDLKNIYDIVQFLDKILGLGIFSKSEVQFHKRQVDYAAAREAKKIFYKARPFNNFDLQWWAKRCIDAPLLTEHRVKSALYLLDECYVVKRTFKPRDKAFAMHVMGELKFYCPESKKYKWRNTCTSNHIFGAEQCKWTKDLIITKALKDIMTFKSFMNIDAIAPQGEGNVWDDKFIAFLKQKYRNVYVVMDYDSAGIEAAERFKAHGFIIRYVDTKQEYIDGKLTVKDKDISDYAFYHGPHATLAHLKLMFPEFDASIFREDRPEHLTQLLLTLEKTLNNGDENTGEELDDILF